MRDYGKVHSSFWTSADIRALSDDARTLALYLLSCGHGTQIGCFRLPDGYVAEDLGWSSERVSNGFGELIRMGFATRDDGSKWLLIFRFLKWNRIDNPNQGKAAAKLFEQVPDLPLKTQLAQALREFCPAFPDAVLMAFERVSKPIPKPIRIQEQEQEQEPLPTREEGTSQNVVQLPTREGTDGGRDDAA